MAERQFKKVGYIDLSKVVVTSKELRKREKAVSKPLTEREIAKIAKAEEEKESFTGRFSHLYLHDEV